VTHKRIIFFDGVCNLCNGAVNFVIDRDPQGLFKLAPLQSEIATKYLDKERISKLDSIVLYEDGKIYEKSTAALKIAKKLNGAWFLLYVFIVIPPFIRNIFYNIVAKYRYKWFGKRETCRMPTTDIKDRFL
jgi:predicted DCC family thiol-disulfide oxidoreductase YuxK